MSNVNDDGGEEAAQALLDRAAQIRAEIAALEGKTLEDVEREAREKKEQQIAARQAAEKEARQNKSKPRNNAGRMLAVPECWQDMIQQAARAIERARRDGHHRQTVRLALVREDQAMSELNQWPGGAQQMYREAAKPLTTELLREIRTLDGATDMRRPPKIIDQDIWDFDGSALITAEAQEGPEGDVQAMVFPNTDVKYINDIDTIDRAFGDRLFLLVNPFWRNLDSWGINILAPGAKKKAKEIIFDKGYDETYVFLRFSCRGEECVAIKAYPYDWQIFAYREDDNMPNWENTIRLGSSEEEPKSSYVTELLNARPEFQLTKTLRQMNR